MQQIRHNPRVTYDILSPDEVTSSEIEIHYGIVPSPFGLCVIGLTARRICTIAFIDRDIDGAASQAIQETWPRARLVRDDARVKPYRHKVFGPRRDTQSIPLLLKGTDFQIKVWQALLNIPAGKTATYAGIARATGSPKASRAVGTACGKNPVAYLIPCHRVLTSQGKLGGYHWGVARKEAMLARETQQ